MTALPPETIDNLIDNEKFFEDYHMNKKHWLAICLNGSIIDHIDDHSGFERIAR